MHLFTFLFADEVALFSDTTVGLHNQLNILCRIAKTLDLTVNINKSVVIIFRNRGFIASRETWLHDEKT